MRRFHFLICSYDLGLDVRGKELNSSARKNHNFGANKKVVFPRRAVEVEEKERTGLRIS